MIPEASEEPSTNGPRPRSSTFHSFDRTTYTLPTIVEAVEGEAKSPSSCAPVGIAEQRLLDVEASDIYRRVALRELCETEEEEADAAALERLQNLTFEPRGRDLVSENGRADFPLQSPKRASIDETIDPAASIRHWSAVVNAGNHARCKRSNSRSPDNGVIRRESPEERSVTAGTGETVDQVRPEDYDGKTAEVGIAESQRPVIGLQGEKAVSRVVIVR